jgi:hypothetical protein
MLWRIVNCAFTAPSHTDGEGGLSGVSERVHHDGGDSATWEMRDVCGESSDRIDHERRESSRASANLR